MRKEGQMKIQQMAFMLIAVTLLFVFVGLFFLKIVISDIGRSSNVLEEKNALLLVSKIADSPEFSCGNSFGSARLNCVDFDKIIVLKDFSEDYREFWGVKGIRIEKIYPREGDACTKGNYPNCGEIDIVGQGEGIGVSNFVSLCRKASGEGIKEACEVAKIIVYYEN